MRRVLVRCANSLAVSVVALGVAAPATFAQASEADKLAAEVAKLEAETAKLENDNQLLGRLPGYGAVLAGLVALGGLGLTLRQQRNDRVKERADADARREREREEREGARTKRFDEQFTQIVASLTSPTPVVRASAAASIQTFLKPEHHRFHSQVVTLLSANLKFPCGDVADRIIGSAYAQALQDHKDELRDLCGARGPDLLEATLKRADLSGLDLRGVEMFRANLHGSNFRGARLEKANARYADLSSATLTDANLGEAHMEHSILEHARLGGARLVSTKLQNARAEHADFGGAALQEANFDGADLRAARFGGANLNNAFFRGARFDTPALTSILDAENWRKANLDANVRSELEQMDAARA